MNRPKTRTTRARFRIIRANGKLEQHILILDPAELHSFKVNVFVELPPGDRLEQARPKTLSSAFESNRCSSPVQRCFLLLKSAAHGERPQLFGRNGRLSGDAAREVIAHGV